MNARVLATALAVVLVAHGAGATKLGMLATTPGPVPSGVSDGPVPQGRPARLIARCGGADAGAGGALRCLERKRGATSATDAGAPAPSPGLTVRARRLEPPAACKAFQHSLLLAPRAPAQGVAAAVAAKHQAAAAALGQAVAQKQALVAAAVQQHQAVLTQALAAKAAAAQQAQAAATQAVAAKVAAHEQAKAALAAGFAQTHPLLTAKAAAFGRRML
jgi:hypothetical protein